MKKPEFSIIALTVEARGEIITNNLPEFRELVREALMNINRDLISDEDFGQAELDVKSLKAAESAVRNAAIQAFDERLKKMVDDLNETAEEIRLPRLEIEKLIAKRKLEVVTEIIDEALATLDLDAPLAGKHYLKGMQSEVKGKRTIESMRKACMTYAAIQQSMINKCRGLLDSFEAAHGAAMTLDRRTLQLETPEGLEAELRRRFEAARAAAEKKELSDALAARLNPHNLPTPPKIGSIQVGTPAPEKSLTLTNEVTEDEEWNEMIETIKQAFATIKAHREKLTHKRNIEKTLAFGALVNEAWSKCKQDHQ